MDVGKEKGFVLYDEMSDVLAEEFPSGREFEDLLSDLDTAGVEILDEPKLDFEKKVEEGEEFVDLELAVEGGGLQVTFNNNAYVKNPTLQGHPGAAGAAHR